MAFHRPRGERWTTVGGPPGQRVRVRGYCLATLWRSADLADERAARPDENEADRVMPSTATAAVRLPSKAQWPSDVRLVASDMDGTLLDEDGRLPDDFWPVLEGLAQRGITFVPASGRQLGVLHRAFAGRAPAEPSFIAENGHLVVHRGRTVFQTRMDPASVRRAIRAVRAAGGRAPGIGLVLSGLESAYIEHPDPAFAARARHYWTTITEVSDLLDVRDDILKAALVGVAPDQQEVVRLITNACPGYRLVASAPDWLDILRRDVNKGTALRLLQRQLGVLPSQSIAFGNYPNDAELLGAAGHGFAVANSHPDLLPHARWIAPTNIDLGVVRVLEMLLAQQTIHTDAHTREVR